MNPIRCFSGPSDTLVQAVSSDDVRFFRKVDSMSDEEWNDFLDRLKKAIHKVLNNLAEYDVRHKFLHRLLWTVLEVAAICIQDAQKVITDDMLLSLESMKDSFSRDLRKIYHRLRRLHLDVQDPGQENKNNEKKRKHMEADLEYFADDDSSPRKLAKLQQETEKDLLENQSTMPITTQHNVNDGELANEMNKSSPERKMNNKDSHEPEEETASSTFSALQ